MRGGREAGCSSQLLESCAPGLSAAAAVARFTSTSAASGENLRGRAPHLRALSTLASPACCWKHAGARIETGSATGETRCSFVIMSPYFLVDCV